LFNKGVKQYLKYRYNRIEAIRKQPRKLQLDTLKSLVKRAKNTEYGREYGFSEIERHNDFTNQLPITDYEYLKEDIYRMMKGAQNVLWPGEIKWYSKSSGTTSDRSKYIPISNDAFYKNNVACSWDTMSMVYHEDPGCQIFQKKSLIMGGAIEKWEHNENVTVGDVSAILLHRMPPIGRPFYSPDFQTAILKDWEEKIDKMASVCSEDDVVMFGGVPTWSIVLFNKMIEVCGAENMEDIWPNIKYYFHGGVGFDPYIDQFKSFFPDKGIRYFEVYNASEGYFAIQDRSDKKGMLLLLNNDIFYEFVSVDELSENNPKAIPIWEVEMDKNYAIVISTSGGLWRYMLGDTVVFTSVEPYRIRVSGRTKHFINVFGEEVMVANTDKALAMTIERMPALVTDYTVAPLYMQTSEQGGHQWLIEFEKQPNDVAAFEALLDKNLQKVNSDYAAKRFKDLALKNLSILLLPSGTIHKWLASKGKIGGQNKVPRLFNDRRYADELIAIMKGQL